MIKKARREGIQSADGTTRSSSLLTLIFTLLNGEGRTENQKLITVFIKYAYRPDCGR